MQHFKRTFPLAGRALLLFREHFIPIQSSPPNTVGAHGCLAPSVAMGTSGNQSYRTLNPFVLSRLGSASTTQSLTPNCRYASPQRDDSSRIRIHDPSKRNGIDGHSDYLIHVIFRLFSIASDRQTSYPSPLNELSRIIITSNGSRLGDHDFLLDRAGVRAKALDFLHEILALDDLTCGEEKREKESSQRRCFIILRNKWMM